MQQKHPNVTPQALRLRFRNINHKKKCETALHWIYCHPLFDERKFSHRFSYLLSETLAQQEITLHRFDYLGTGDDPHSFANVTLTSLRADLSAQCRGKKPLGLIGLRLGASLALEFALTHREEVENLILLEPILYGPGYVNHLFRKQRIKDLLSATSHEQQTEDAKHINVEGFKTHPQLIQPLRDLDLVIPANNHLICQINHLPPFWERISDIDYRPIIQKVLNHVYT